MRAPTHQRVAGPEGAKLGMKLLPYLMLVLGVALLRDFNRPLYVI
jgi:hypothetical protein